MVAKKDTVLANTHVPDKVYAYGIQIHQMLYELLNCDIDCVVSVEKIDDIGIENEDYKIAIQMKSTLSNKNPISNKSKDLWKTLYNWLLGLKNKELPFGSTVFKLIINVDKEGDIVNSLADAKNSKESEKVYNKIKDSLIDKNGKFIGTSDSVATYIETFLAEDNKKFALYIIEKFDISVIGPKHTQRLYKEFISKTYLPPRTQEIAFDKILGWIDKTTALQIENGQAMQISKKDFSNEMVLIQENVNQRYCLVESAQEPSKKEIELQQTNHQFYVRQLEIIDLGKDELLVAINDYLKASVNRTRWAIEGYVNEEKINNYFDDLKRSWQIKKNFFENTNEEYDENKRGRCLYFQCLDQKIDMEGIIVSRSFMCGCYHELANQLKIGWHPRYIEKLKVDDNDDQ